MLSATNLFVDTCMLPLRLARITILGWPVFKLMVGNRPGLWLTCQLATRRKRELSWAQFSQHLIPHGIEYPRRIFQRSLADLQRNYQAVQDALSGIQCPTLILWGANDPFFAATIAERTQTAIPRSQLKVCSESVHFVPEEAQAAHDIPESFSGSLIDLHLIGTC